MINKKLTPITKLNTINENDSINKTAISKPQIKHTISLKPKDSDNDSKFTENGWNNVVKQNIQSTLKNIPVLKSLQSKQGKGVLFFPNAETRKIAVEKLQNSYDLETQDIRHTDVSVIETYVETSSLTG